MRRTSPGGIAAIVMALVSVGAGCGLDNSIVGGACAVPYVECGNQCILVDSDPRNCGACGHACAPGIACSAGACADALQDPDGSSDGAPGDGSFSDGTTGGDGSPDGSDWLPDGGGPDAGCVAPQIDCDGFCLDPTGDPNNCGSCGKVCPSNSCVGGVCAGSAAGHVIAIGHDYQVAPSMNSSQARVLANAVFIPQSSPINLLSYEHYSVSGDVINVKTVLAAQAKKLGRSLAITSTVKDSDVSSTLDINTYDLLLIPDQRSAPSGTLKTVGGGWATSGKIDTFLHAGGVVVVLDGGTGTAEMPDFVTAMAILTVNADTILSSPSLTVLAPGDAVGTSLISPYVPTKSTVWFDTEAASSTVTYVVGKGASEPVVVHKVVM